MSRSKNFDVLHIYRLFFRIPLWRVFSSRLAGLAIVSSVTMACQSRPTLPPPQADGSLVLARLGDDVITDHALKHRIEDIESQYPVKYSTHPQKMELLQELINLELLYKEALARGMQNDFVFKAKMADAYLARLSQEALRAMPADAVKKFYLDNRNDIDQISARHILLKWPTEKSKVDRESIRKKMEGILKQVKAEPASFGRLAREHSEDTSSQSEGELGFFNFAQMVEPFSKAAFALKKVGDISPIVESQFGLHIIQLSGEKRSLEHFEGAIRDQLVRNSQQERYNKELTRLRGLTKIEVYEETLRTLSPLPEVMLTDPKELIPENFSPGTEDKEPSKK